MERVLITAALPYANGAIHFGHIAGAYLPADAYARFQRLKDFEVLYICGSDEYGVAVTMSAELAHRTPKQQVDHFHELNQKIFARFGISFDHYSRTTWSGHIPVVQKFFLELYENGFIEEKEEYHLFSSKENKFLADRYVIGTCPKCGFEKARGDECPKCGASYEAIDLINPLSKRTDSPLEKRLSKHWYLRFDLFKDRLKTWLDKKSWKSNVMNFTQNYLKDLKPRAVTRDASWGVPLPLKNEKDKVLYVWFDAPIGYITATMEWAEKNNIANAWKKFWLDANTKYVQFLGKDNIPFHTLFFPAMIMGQNTPYKLVDDVPANEFLLYEGRQFSKSDNWMIDLDDFFGKYTVDQARYYLAANAPESSDAEFTWKEFQVRCNSELLGKLGNFVNRTLTFIKNNYSKKIPEQNQMDDTDHQFLQTIETLMGEASTAYSQYQLKKAAHILMELAQASNVYFDTKKPWQLIKDESSKAVCDTTLHLCTRAICVLAFIAYPIIPETAESIWQMLGFNESIASNKWMSALRIEMSKQKIKEIKILFRKVEDEEIKKEMDKLNIPEEAKAENVISFKDFQKVKMVVGEIVQAEKVDKSEKLLKLQVNIGSETRQIVSGIAKFYTSEELLGKKVVVVTNLKSAKLMGIESQGMILAAGDDTLELLFVTDQKPGSIVC